MTSLKKKNILLCMLPFMVACLVLSTSCFRNSYGYPKEIFMPAEGGEVLTEGDKTVTDILFLNGNTFENASEKEYYESGRVRLYRYQWITIENIYSDATLRIVAKPNETGSQRKITIQLSYPFTLDLGEIKITQGAQ